MKKLLTFSLAFMLAVLFNTNAFAQLSNYVVSPPEGEVTKEELKEIRITFPDAQSLTTGWKVLLDFYPTYTQKTATIEGNTIVCTDVPERPEWIRLEIAKNQFTDQSGNSNPYLEFNWTIVAGVEPFAFESAVPANNATVNKLEEIVLNFGSESVLTGSATVNVAGQQLTFAPTATPGQVKATLPQPIKAEGAYSFTIPENSFTVADGSYNEAVTVNYTVAIPEMDANSILVSPAAGANVMGLNTIAIEFPEPISVNEAAGAITFSNGATVENIEIQKYTAIITANAPAGWQLGQYTLNVPKGYFVGENGKNPALSYSWNIIAATLSIDDFVIYSGETKEVAIKLNSEMPFAAFQADVRLPEGLELVGDFQLLRGTDHTFSTRVQKDGSIRLLSYSLTNANYAGNSGDALVKFQVKAAADYNQTRQITIDNIAFTTKEGNEFELDAAAANAEGRLFVSSITIAPEALNLETNETAKVTATVLPENAYSAKFEWSSSNPDIVAIDEEGNVVAKAAGNANIIATATDGSGVTAQIPVTVVYTHATALTITPATVLFEVGSRQTLTATLDKETNKAADIVWTSNNPEVAEIVITEGVVEVVGKAIGQTTVIAQLKNGNEVVLENTIPVVVDATMATSVTVEPTELTLETGQKFIFTAVVNIEATNKNVRWTSSDPTKVAVNEETGEVEALALTNEPVVITATAADGGGAKGTAQVTVVQSLATGIVINLENAELEATGDERGQVQLTATVTPATNKAIVWKSSNEEVAAVDANGLVTALAVGEAEISATIEGTALSAICVVKVLPSYATQVTINYGGETKFETGADADIKLTTTVAPAYVTDNTVTWTSSDNEIAAVDANGVVTFGEKPGVVTITAKANGAAEGQEVKATINFEVVYTLATAIAIDQEPFTFKANDRQQLTATTDAATNKAILWTSSDAKVATVDADGLVTAVGVGQATITATIEGTEIADTLVVTVEATDGDVNNDGEVDILDVTATAAYILGDEVDPFIFAAADLNIDSKVNVTDIVYLVNIILTQQDDENTPAAVAARMMADSDNSLYIEDFDINEGETKQIAVKLNNNMGFIAFQADFYLPEGLQLVESSLSARKSADHVLTSALRDSGAVRMLSYSLGLNEFAESEGDLIYLTVKADKDFIGDFQIEIDNIRFVDADQNKYHFASASANVKGIETTGIENVEGDELEVKVVGNSIVAPEGAEVYDLNGLRVDAENLAKGIYIVKVGNQIVKVVI